MGRTIFLDLYGVLVDSQVMERDYNRRMAGILHRRFGGSLVRWEAAQAESYVWYQREGTKLDARPGPTREGPRWVHAVQRMNAKQVAYVLGRVGKRSPGNLGAFAEALEAETVLGIDALYPDARPALQALRSVGHRLFLSTNANRSNAESALVGAHVRDLFEGLAMLETTQSKKDRPYYWRRAFAMAGVEPNGALVVDDAASFLAPAAELGASCIQLLRPDRAHQPRGPWPVIDSLTALPMLVRD